MNWLVFQNVLNEKGETVVGMSSNSINGKFENKTDKTEELDRQIKKLSEIAALGLDKSDNKEPLDTSIETKKSEQLSFGGQNFDDELAIGADLDGYTLGEVANGEGKNIKYDVTGEYLLGKGVTFNQEKRQLNGKITAKPGKYPIVYHAFEDKTQNTVLKYIIFSVYDRNNPEKKPSLSFEGKKLDDKLIKGGTLHEYMLGRINKTSGKQIEYFILGEKQLGEGVTFNPKNGSLNGKITEEKGEYNLLYGARNIKTGEMTTEHIKFKIVEDFKDLK